MLRPGLAQAQLTLSWAPREDLNILLPPSVRVFEAFGTLPSGRRVHAHYAEVRPEAEVRAVAAQNGQRTTQVLHNEQNALLTINGGFFVAPSASIPSGSVSLVVTDSVVVARNIASLTRPGANNMNQAFFPTRGAFGLVRGSLQPEVAWIGHVGSLVYAYPNPSPNQQGQAPQPQPSATFPAGGRIWSTQTAIGGAPVLVWDGQRRVTVGEELLQADIPPPNPRTAIGHRADRTVIMLVVDGRQPGLSDGADLDELADLMRGLGCTAALNLDGGGSSTLVVRDLVANIPSNANFAQRTVGSVVTVRSRTAFASPPVLVFGNEDRGVYRETGTWEDAPDLLFQGTGRSRVAATSVNGTARAFFRFGNVRPGRYQVAAWWTTAPDRATEAPFTIYTKGRPNVVRANQADQRSLNKWNILGNFIIQPGDSLALGSDTPTGARVCADAVRLVLTEDLPTAVEAASLPLAMKLQVAPNPAVGEVQVRYQLPAAARVRLRVCDALGRSLADLSPAQAQAPGEHLATWPAPAPGLYLVMLETEQGRQVARVVVGQ